MAWLHISFYQDEAESSGIWYRVGWGMSSILLSSTSTQLALSDLYKQCSHGSTCWNWVIFNDLVDILGCIFIAIEVSIHVATWLSWEYFLKLTFKGGHELGFNRIFNEQLWYWPIIASRITNETSQGMQDILTGCSGTDYRVKLEQCFTPKRRLHHTIKSIWLEILFIKAFSENKAYKHWYL
jgi:hypothetical protein